MAYDEDDDLFEEVFDFMDEDEEEAIDDAADEPVEQQEQPERKKNKPAKSGRKPAKRGARGEKQDSQPPADGQGDDQGQGKGEKGEAAATEEAPKPEEPAGPPTDHVVHIYEFGKFKRTIGREFTGDDASAFATEFNRTSGAHCREAVAANREAEPAPAL